MMEAGEGAEGRMFYLMHISADTSARRLHFSDVMRRHLRNPHPVTDRHSFC